MKTQTKIPTLFALLLILGIMGFMVFFFNRVTQTDTKASASIQPSNIMITNITDTTFTVSWLTSSKVTGTIQISASGIPSQTILDDRDTLGKLTPYTTHHITYRMAKPQTTYSVQILSNGSSFVDINKKPYEITTGRALASGSNGLEPAYGNIINADNEAADGALVYLTLDGSQKLSTMVKQSGSWLIPLNLIRLENLQTYTLVGDRATEQITVRLGDEDSTAITDTLNDSPVPTIVIGKTYDFRKQQAKADTNILAIKPSPISSPTPLLAKGKETTAVLGTQTASSSAINFPVKLIAPAQGATMTSRQPLIQGTGIPDKLVTLTLGITNPTSGSTRVGSDGLWRFTPPIAMGTGRQSVTMTSVDNKGKAIAITHIFEIFKSGTQVLGDATPSASLTPTSILTSTPTPTTVLLPTGTPIASPTAQPIPVTATSLPTIIILLIGSALLIGGIAVIL